MPLTSEEKDLVSGVRHAQIQWQVQRWLALVIFAGMGSAGFLLPYQDARIFGFLGVILVIDTLRRWKGDATRRLVLLLAKRIDEDTK